MADQITEERDELMDEFFDTVQYDEEVDWRAMPELGEDADDGDTDD